MLDPEQYPTLPEVLNGQREPDEDRMNFLMETAVRRAREGETAAVEYAVAAMLLRKSGGVRVRTVFENWTWTTTASLDYTVPYGEIHYEKVSG